MRVYPPTRPHRTHRATVALVVLCAALLAACRPITRPTTDATTEASTEASTDGASDARIYTLQGQIARGESLALPLEGGLMFRLAPLGEDWEIQITPTEEAAEQAAGAETPADYSFVITPPFRTLNSRQLQGWHFRTADNSGPNAPGPNNVNAPQEQRHFCYVLDAESYTLAFSRFHEQGNFAAGLEDIHAAGAHFTIQSLELGNLVPGEQAWIESMQFSLEYGPDVPCELFN